MTGNGLLILMAAAFTFGCAAIHEMREHPKELTGALALVVVVLGTSALVMMVVQTPEIDDGAIVRVADRRVR